MITTLSRIIHFGVKNFWRNGVLSTATVAIMVLALLMGLGLILFGVTTDRAIASVQDKIDISVYFTTATPEDQILNIKQSIEALTEVKSEEYVSRDKALELFKAEHANDEIGEALSLLEANPLEASLNIKATAPDLYASIAESLQNPNLGSYISNVSYYENQIVIDRLVAIIKNVNRGGLALIIALSLVAGLIVFNTVRLAIYSNRDEIGIMRAVGASNALVRGPFLVNGVIVGVVAAVVSLIAAMPAIGFVSPYLEGFIPGFSMSSYSYTGIIGLFGWQLLFGVGIATLSSFMAVRRYLKN